MNFYRKNRTLLLGIALLVVLILAATTLVGCATDPTTRWAQAREGLTSTTNLAIVAAESGRMSDREIIAADESIQAARAGLDAAEEHLPDGGDGFDQWLNIADTVITELKRRFANDPG